MRAIRESPLRGLIKQGEKFDVFVGRGLAPAAGTQSYGINLCPHKLLDPRAGARWHRDSAVAIRLGTVGCLPSKTIEKGITSLFLGFRILSGVEESIFSKGNIPLCLDPSNRRERLPQDDAHGGMRKMNSYSRG